MPMTGIGEMTFSPDSNSGTLRPTAEGMGMTVNLAGAKIGTCRKPQ
jgi:hypothetical protein